MAAIMAQPGPDAHAHPDLAARRRRDRLARATAEQMEAALAFLSVIDPEAFEIAFTAVAAAGPAALTTLAAPTTPASPAAATTLAAQAATAAPVPVVAGERSEDHPGNASEDGEAVPVCRECGGLAGVFLDRGLGWQHFRGDWITPGAQEIYDPGHAAVVTWIPSHEEQADL